MRPEGNRRKQKTTSSTPGCRKSRPWAVASTGSSSSRIEDHREVVDAERPEGVLVRPDPPEVLPVAVDAEHLAESARLDQLLQLLHARVIEQEVARHENEVAFGGEGHELVDLAALHRRRLLDEHVLAGLEGCLRELVVRRDGRRNHDRVELGVAEHLLERLRPPRLRIPRLELVVLPVRRVAEPRQVGEVGEVPREVLPPLAEPRLAHPKAQSFQTLSERLPFAPVAFRRSTTSTASSTSAS